MHHFALPSSHDSYEDYISLHVEGLALDLCLACSKFFVSVRCYFESEKLMNAIKKQFTEVETRIPNKVWEIFSASLGTGKMKVKAKSHRQKLKCPTMAKTEDVKKTNF
jgi:hypothetical protein